MPRITAHNEARPMTAQRLRRSATWLVACGLVLRIASVAAAADAVEAEPLLRLDTGGPASFVTALTFEPGSRTLYAGGFDKLVRAWSLAGDRFQLDQQQTIRVPRGTRAGRRRECGRRVGRRPIRGGRRTRRGQGRCGISAGGTDPAQCGLDDGRHAA